MKIVVFEEGYILIHLNQKINLTLDKLLSKKDNSEVLKLLNIGKMS